MCPPSARPSTDAGLPHTPNRCKAFGLDLRSPFGFRGPARTVENGPMDSYSQKEVNNMKRIDPANAEQLRLLISLHYQLGIDYDPEDLAGLSKWAAAELINQLRGRPTASQRQLDQELLDILRIRNAELADDEPTPPVEEPERDNRSRR
jgi:hypothetical protein